jgi:hypothetical protein
MFRQASVVDARVLDDLLADVVDTREKLEVAVHLHGGADSLTTSTISAQLGLPWVLVAEALGELHRAGIVSTSNDDDAGWWLDDLSPWRHVVGVLARLYANDRTLLLRRMSRVALHRLRAVRRTDVPHVIRLRFKYEP